MATSDCVYDSIGMRTRNGVYWMAVLFCVLTINVVVMQHVQTDHPPYRLAMQGVWIAGVFLFTVRILRRLGNLETGCSEPDDSMKLLFHCANMLPIIGYLPFILRGGPHPSDRFSSQLRWNPGS